MHLRRMNVPPIVNQQALALIGLLSLTLSLNLWRLLQETGCRRKEIPLPAMRQLELHLVNDNHVGLKAERPV